MVAEAAAEQTLAELLLARREKARTQAAKRRSRCCWARGSRSRATRNPPKKEKAKRYTERERLLAELRAGRLENEMVEVEVEEQGGKNDAMFAAGIDLNIGEMFGDFLPKKTKRRKLPVKEARRVIVQQESEKRIDMDDVHREALQRAEQDGIIFIDEIDKIAGAERVGGPDVSREGVQRDILPIVEGSVVSTKYGPVKTDYMLFIAAGAFHTAKVSDLIPELQGRFPIRVKLDALTQEDFEKILTQPENAVTKQYTALLSADKVKLSFSGEALKEIAKFAYIANENTENIGARRLHTVMENLLDDISFNANGQHPEIELNIDADYVDEHLGEEFHEDDIHKYIL